MFSPQSTLVGQSHPEAVKPAARDAKPEVQASPELMWAM